MRRLTPLIAVALLTGCTRGDTLTAEGLAAAKARWADQGLTSYRMEVEITGDRVEEGHFRVSVEDGAVTEVSRNDKPVVSRDAFYTIDGMFSMLGDELRMAQQAQRYWQAAEGARVYQRAYFDPDRGYCRRYLRAVTGTQHNIVIEVHQLTPGGGT